jgi:hypothetical protein
MGPRGRADARYQSEEAADFAADAMVEVGDPVAAIAALAR